MAKFPPITLKEGDKAPSFTAVSTSGETIKLSQFKGNHVVLYFYPKDNTPGCNKQACAFRDTLPKFKRRKTVILGVSIDSVASHVKFTRKFDLPFPLLSDEDKEIVRAYGVWGEKQFMGRTFQGTHRVTFLIDPKGRIQRIWAKVKPETHPEEILAELAAK